jgi:hypothetical protein
VRQKEPKSVGMIGLQPAILQAMTKNFGPENLSCVDRDEEFRGQSKFGVPITWGDEQGLQVLFQKSDLVLSTGSTIVNGSLPGILDLADRCDVPIYFYGTSIATVSKGFSGKHGRYFMVLKRDSE